MLRSKGIILFFCSLAGLFGLLYLALNFFVSDVDSIKNRDFIEDFFIFRLSLYSIFLVAWRLFARRYVMFVHDVQLAKRKTDSRLTNEIAQQYTDSMESTARESGKPKTYLKIAVLFLVIEFVMIRQFTI